MDDGKEEVFGPGDVGSIPPGHDGWTIGNEPVVWLEIRTRMNKFIIPLFITTNVSFFCGM